MEWKPQKGQAPKILFFFFFPRGPHFSSLWLAREALAGAAKGGVWARRLFPNALNCQRVGEIALKKTHSSSVVQLKTEQTQPPWPAKVDRLNHAEKPGGSKMSGWGRK